MLFISCNPFSPEYSEFENSVSIGSKHTIKGLMQSFAYSYTFKDSFLYETFLDTNFTFVYDDNGTPQTWNREEDIVITKRMFRSFSRLDLLFNSDLPVETPEDTTLIVSFTLTLSTGTNENTFTGHARFSYKRHEMEKDSFEYKIYNWEDLK